jgi:hypothetical protein
MISATLTIKEGETMEDTVFQGIFSVISDEEDLMVLAHRPDVVETPLGVSKVRELWILENPAPCPNPECRSHRRHGVILLENGLVVICCNRCQSFIFIKITPEMLQ